MAVTLSINAHELAAPPGASIFDLAESVGVPIPTSCRKQGKCRECLVEVAEGMPWLTARGPEEQHLTGDFRLSCRARIAADTGVVRCHTLRRAAMRVESEAINLPGSPEARRLYPAVTRDG
jgi:ferredoxin